MVWPLNKKEQGMLAKNHAKLQHNWCLPPEAVQKMMAEQH